MLLSKHTSKIFVCLSLLFSLSFLPIDSFAATFNVSNVTQLRSVLRTAQNNGQADTINIAAGTYSTGGVPFSYIQPATSENFSLTIVGAGAGRTILDGADRERVLQIFTPLIDFRVVITIRSLTIQHGFQETVGAGLLVQTSSARVVIENCNFSINSANRDGGGAFISTSKSSITLTSNTFTDNSAFNAGGEASGGGASLHSGTGGITLSNNIFTNNFIPLDGSGGGADIETASGAISLTRNTFTDNSVGGSGSGGGADINSNSGAITLTSNTFTNNSVEFPEELVFHNGGGADIGTSSGAITLANNIFTGNLGGGGVDIETNSGAIALANNGFNNNGSLGRGGAAGIINNSGTITLLGNSFDDNGASSTGGADIFSGSGNVSLRNNIFTNNGSDFGVGGASVGNDSGDIIFTNNVFINNSAGIGDGGADLSNGTGDITLTNNTFTLNSSNSPPLVGGLRISVDGDNSIINIYNNIAFGNTAGGNTADIVVIDHRVGGGVGSTVNLFNNDFTVFSCFGLCGSNIIQGNNINLDPLFVDAPNGNVHLRGGSPAINAGNLFAPALPSTDFEGDQRILDTTPDIGADEILTCGGLVPIRLGTNGDDVINGTSGSDVIAGLAGNDTLSGLGGVDRICGGDGMDTINGGSGGDFLFGDRDNDTLNGGDGNDRLFGGAGDDTMNGGNNTDICEQNGAADTFQLCESIITFSAGLLGVWVGDVMQACDKADGDLICTILGILEVENPGTDTAPTSTTRFFLSLDETLDDSDTLLQETQVGPLEPKEVEEVSLDVGVPEGLDAIGQFIIAVLDVDDVVPEANEENNEVVSPAVTGQVNNVGVSSSGCSIVQSVTPKSIPLYVLMPVFIVMRRFWRRYIGVS